MLYCFDLDDVIADTYPVIMESSLMYHKNVLRRGVPGSERKCRLSKGDYFYFAKSLGWDKKEVVDFYHEYYPFFLEEVEVRKSSRKVMQRLHDAGHQICVLSARELRNYVDVEQMTRNWLTENQIPFNQLIVGAKNKQRYLEMMDCFVFVDDNYNNCIAAVNAHVPRVYYYRCEYNQGFVMPGRAEICCINSLEALF